MTLDVGEDEDVTLEVSEDVAVLVDVIVDVGVRDGPAWVLTYTRNRPATLRG